ncbi:hypothetical protein E6R60_26720 [Streptomyces sp. A0642]|uniref:hypothetical protein n=1 Tax=Streptomyces sp. A0642 TaxID=2563100 RepID=UPI0010A26C5D|nr:hypothetical protein [Streptomyces sp. A0642]THA72524.1 hypothetical protein E6R60_26720 [Streptomyces sp. A0642]
MPTITDPRVTQAAEVIREAAVAAAPGLPTFADVVDRLTDAADVSSTTARKRIRQAIEQSGGTLHELRLTVDSMRAWRVTLPDTASTSAEPGVRTWLSRFFATGADGRSYYEVTYDSAKGTHAHGAGQTSWVITSERIDAIRQARAAVEEARQAEEAAASRTERDTQQAEIERRHPGLEKLLHRFGCFLDPDAGFDAITDAHLTRAKDGMPTEERRAVVNVTVRSPEAIARLEKVLSAGLAAVEAQEVAAKQTASCKAPDSPSCSCNNAEYRFCGATLDRTEPPFTCNRRVAHNDPCSPDLDKESC